MDRNNSFDLRFTGAVVSLIVVRELNDTEDLEPLQLQPIQLSAQAFRNFDVDAVLRDLEEQLDTASG